MTTRDVAAALDEIGVLLQLKGEDDFRSRAYAAASRAIEQLPGDMRAMVADGSLSKVRGIGEAIRDKVTTLVTTGRLPYLDDLRASIPPGLLAMLRINGVGPKKVRAIHHELGVDTVAGLKAACEDGSLAKLKGFGAKTAEKILAGIAFLDSAGERVRYDRALALGGALLAELKALPGVIRGELAGSLRRGKETVGDLDLVLSSADPTPIMAAFVALPQVVQVLGHGPTKSSVIAALELGKRTVTMQADLRVVPDAEFPVTLLYMTGSKEHNVRLRQLAIEMGMSLNDYALTADDVPVPVGSEADVYAELGLQFVPPEMREDAGEVELAAKKAIPKLVEFTDLRGVFHNHTTASDGTGTLEEMAAAARALGWEYLGIADHSQSLTVANGLTPDRVRAQWQAIDAINAKSKGFRLLKGTECDILADGSLDFDDELLAGFEYVVASVHSLFGLSEEEQTARICKALAHPAVTMLGHATGRLLLRREGYKVNLEAVLQAAAKHGKMVEINAQPDRLDLDWRHVRRAKQLGVTLVINPDAHSPDGLGVTACGVVVARRGGLSAADVFNTRPLAGVLKRLTLPR
jgi:DNA polymerase (family 10)